MRTFQGRWFPDRLSRGMNTLVTRLQPAVDIPAWVGWHYSQTIHATETNDADNRHVFRLFVFVYFSAAIADFYSMSYLWISGLSVLTAFVVGIVMSLILGKFTTDN